MLAFFAQARGQRALPCPAVRPVLQNELACPGQLPTKGGCKCPTPKRRTRRAGGPLGRRRGERNELPRPQLTLPPVRHALQRFLLPACYLDCPYWRALAHR